MAVKTPKGISPALLRFFLIFSSLFLLACGVFLTSLGLYVLYHASGIGVDRNFLLLPACITFLGLLVISTGIVGLVCVFYQFKCLTGTFVAMTLLVIVLQVVGGSVVLVLSENLAKMAADAIETKVGVVSKAHAEENEAFRSFQITMNCCGYKGPSDYGEGAKLQCCADATCNAAPAKGCAEFVTEVAHKYKVPYGLMMIIFGVMQVSAIVSSIVWAKWKRKPLLV